MRNALSVHNIFSMVTKNSFEEKNRLDRPKRERRHLEVIQSVHFLRMRQPKSLYLQVESATTRTAAMAQSIFSRKRDLLYMIFFIIHIPVMFGNQQKLHALSD
jgi:hypothetical protein